MITDMIKENKFVIVIILYNPNKSILKLLDELSSFDKIIIDNSEVHNHWIVDQLNNYSNLSYKTYGVNLGIAASLNKAAVEAINMGYHYMVSLDQDSELDGMLMQHLWNKLHSMGNIDKVATFSPLHLSSGVTHHKIVEEFSNGIFGLQSANLINLSIWSKLGGFNELLFIDMVDTDYYIRAKIAGYDCITCNNVCMVHQVGEDVKEIKVFGKYIRAFNHSYIRKYYQARNFMYVYFKYRDQVPEVKYFMKIILMMPITIILFESDKFRKLLYYFKGIKDLYYKNMGKLID